MITLPSTKKSPGVTHSSPFSALVAQYRVDRAISKIGLHDGKATVTATGGTMPYAFKWSNGHTEDSADGLGPGGWVVTVTDAEGTLATTHVFMSEPSMLWFDDDDDDDD